MSLAHFQNLQAADIDGVIASLDKIIEWAKANHSRMGYFAALYRKVTVKVKEGIVAGVFDDGARMERLDVIFANRYLEAFEQYHAAGKLTRCWTLAFDTSKRWRPLVLQHLMVGMNAHIELDLGIAAAETAPGEGLDSLKGDFFKINQILGSLVNGVQDELARVWPGLKLLDRFAGKADEGLANFGMKITRGRAWQVAETLAPLSQADRTAVIETLDAEVTKVGGVLLFQGYFFSLVMLLIRLTEKRSVRKIIEILQ